MRAPRRHRDDMGHRLSELSCGGHRKLLLNRLLPSVVTTKATPGRPVDCNLGGEGMHRVMALSCTPHRCYSLLSQSANRFALS